jgi:ssDNA-binding Zn-finger/Zn-ribbon topoisomerase 1
MNPKTKPKIKTIELTVETLNAIFKSNPLLAGEVVKCPECGEAMEKGFIISNAIRWSNKKHTQWALGQEVIVPWHLTALTNVEASRCPKCRLVLFHYQIPRAEETLASFLKECVKCGEAIPVASDYCPKCGAKQKEEKGSQ